MAAPGDVVSIAAGTYPLQTLRRDPAKTSGVEVVFAAAGDVTLAGFWSGDEPKQDSGAKHFELRGVRLDRPIRLNWGTEDATITDVDSPAIEFTSVRDIRVKGGDYGPNVDGISHINACGVPGCYVPDGIVIDGALFHDYTISDPAIHSECLMIWPGKRVTIRNSTFRNCTDFDVLVKPYNTALVGSPGQIVMENNFFDQPIVGEGCLCERAGTAIAITQGDGEAWDGVTIRYNSSLGEIRVDPPITNTVVTANVARKEETFSCQRNVTFSFNVWSKVSCSRTDKAAPLDKVFVGADSTTFDLRLRRGSAAVAHGDPSESPKSDIAGTARPVSFPPDAGASQREPALVVAGSRIGNAKLGAPRTKILEIYGDPVRRTKVKLANATYAVSAQYRVPGGRLTVVYVDDRVAQLSTTSRMYRTPKGMAVGLPLAGASGNPGKSNPQCLRLVRGLYASPKRRTSPLLGELIVTPRRDRPACAVPRDR